MQNSLPKIILYSNALPNSLPLNKIRKGNYEGNKDEMEVFGACNLALQRDLRGELCTLSRYHKSPGLLRRPQEWDTAIGKGVEKASVASLTSPLCLKKFTTLENSSSLGFLKAKLIV